VQRTVRELGLTQTQVRASSARVKAGAPAAAPGGHGSNGHSSMRRALIAVQVREIFW